MVRLSVMALISLTSQKAPVPNILSKVSSMNVNERG